MISVEEFLSAHPVPSATSGEVDRADSRHSGAVLVSRFGAPDDDDSRADRKARRRSGNRRPKRGGFGAGLGTTAYGGGVEDPNDAQACKEAALTLLDSAPRASGALAQRLKRKGYADEAVNATIDRLIEVGLLDDEAYARSMVRYCLSRQLGEHGAVRELSRKGVDAALAARVVEEARRTGAFEESAYELGRKVAARTEGMDSDVRRRRLWSAGIRKGHGPEAIRRVAEELLSEKERNGE